MKGKGKTPTPPPRPRLPVQNQKFVVVTWNMDEGGGFSPVSLPVEAPNAESIRQAILNGQQRLNGFTLPDESMLNNPEAPGEILSLEDWYQRPWNYLEFFDGEGDHF